MKRERCGGATILFNEKYAANIRVKSITDPYVMEERFFKKAMDIPINKKIAPLIDDRLFSFVTEAKYSKRTGIPNPKKAPINPETAK